jgi:putative addiction module antidote
MNVPFKITPLRVTKVGNSAAVILPKKLLAHLGVDQGDMVTVLDTDGGVELRRYDPDFEAQMAVARDVMARRKRALRELAK